MEYQNQILDIIDEPTSFINKDYQYIYVNKAYSRYYKCDTKDIVGKSISDFFGEEHFKEKIKPHFDQCLNGEHVQFENIIAYPDTTRRTYMWMDYYPHYNENQEIDGVIAKGKDRTREYSLSKKLEDIYNSTSEAIVIHDEQTGQMLECNDATLKLYGYDSKDEILQLSVKELSSEKEEFGLTQIRAHIEKAIKNGSHTFEWLAKKKNGDDFWVEVTLQQAMIDGQKRMFAVARDIAERKDLLLQKSLFHNLLEALPDMISIHDDQFNIIYSNWRGFATVPENLRKTGTKCYKTYRNYDTICPDCQAKTVLKTHKTFQADTRLPDGTWFDLRVIPIFNDRGGVDKFVEWVRDITEIKQTEMLLKEKNEQLFEAKEIAEQNEAKFRSYIDHAPDGIFIADEEGRYVEVNPSACKITGYSKAELLNMSIPDLIYEEDISKSRENFQNVVQTGRSSIKLRFVTKNKQARYWSVDAVKLSNTRFLGFTKDITTEILAQEETRILAEMLDTAPNSITIHDENGNFLYANQSAFDLHGYTKQEFSELTLQKLDTPESARLFKERVQIIKEKGFATFEVDHYRKDGTAVPLEIFAKKVYWKDTPALLSVGTDISDRKKWINELVIAKEKAEEASRLKTEFLRNMSHEIRTPMNGIIGFSKMLGHTDISDEDRKFYSKIVQNSGQQLLRIIDDILEISTLDTKQEKLNETEFNLNDLLMDLFSIFDLKFHKGNHVALHLKKALSDEDSVIVSDKTKLNKILSNLLENALKFTSEGFVEFGYLLEENNLVLYVKDSGIGIRPENRKTIFERFSQEEKEISRKHGGLGLGLAISKENAQLLGGDINLVSEKGKGSTFYVSIPFKPQNQKKTKKTSKSSQNTAKPSRDFYNILVAEDEEINYYYIEALFKKEKQYHCVRAENGQEAVDICLKDKNIDLVLMDIKMPVMNGYEATKIIKSTIPEMPVIVQTAYFTESDEKLAFEHGCDYFISKPVDKQKLIKLMRKYLKIESD